MKKHIIITGPTASGKTTLANTFAEMFSEEKVFRLNGASTFNEFLKSRNALSAGAFLVIVEAEGRHIPSMHEALDAFFQERYGYFRDLKYTAIYVTQHYTLESPDFAVLKCQGRHIPCATHSYVDCNDQGGPIVWTPKDRGYGTPDQFYMNFLEGGDTPAHKHATLESAEAEAKRLANKHEKRAFVLCTIKSFEKLAYVEKDCRPRSEDDLPF